MMAKTQADLPGMEDRKISDLVEKAEEYVKVRDKRQDLTRRESELKADLLTLMKKYKKREYVYEGIEIRIVVEEETIKVRIHKPGGEEEDGEQAKAPKAAKA